MLPCVVYILRGRQTKEQVIRQINLPVLICDERSKRLDQKIKGGEAKTLPCREFKNLSQDHMLAGGELEWEPGRLTLHPPSTLPSHTTSYKNLSTSDFSFVREDLHMSPQAAGSFLSLSFRLVDETHPVNRICPELMPTTHHTCLASLSPCLEYA